MNETLDTQPAKEKLKQIRTLSLRAKILLGILVVVLFTVSAMGYFVFYRLQAANSFLVDQFSANAREDIENKLNTITSQEASTINIFFSRMKSLIEVFGKTTEAAISNNNSISIDENSWNVYQMMKLLPTGNWDNANTEPASIYIPGRIIVGGDLAQELRSLKILDPFTLSVLENNPDITAIYYGGKQGSMIYYPNIDLATNLPSDFDVKKQAWFANAITSSLAVDKTAIWSIPHRDNEVKGMILTGSIPVYDATGEFRGVAAIDFSLTAILEQVSNISIGDTGYAFVIDKLGRVVAISNKGYSDFKITEDEIQNSDFENLSLITRVPLNIFEVLAKMTNGQSGVRQVTLNGINRYIAYRPIPVVGYSLGIVVDEDELLQGFVRTQEKLEAETRQTIFNAIGIVVFFLAVAGLASYGIGNSIAAPLEELTKVAQEVASGNLDIRAKVTSRDEVGLLGSTLNSMTSTAQELITDLEGRVAERTKMIERRVAQIQAVAEVGKAVAAQRDLEELLDRTTHLVSNRFGYYHIGIFLLDPSREYAVLRSSNSSGGARMLAREHKLRVGREGIVGTAASTGEARIALDVGEDAVYFDNPDMPETHSEIALPLIAGDEILGVLDVQSVEVNAFSEDDIPALQILADQLATAVQNARLLRDTREALNASQKVYGDISKRGWESLLLRSKAPGFIGMMHGELLPAKKNLDAKTKDKLGKGEAVVSTDQRTLTAPIVTRGQTIGMMRLVKPSYSEPWKSDEVEDIKTLASMISNALESARLYDEAQRRADSERLISEITDGIRSSSNIESILQTAIRELGQKLGATRTYVQLDVPTSNKNGSTESAGGA